jgi:hypothetical protein
MINNTKLTAVSTKKNENLEIFLKGGIYGVVDEAISNFPGVNLIWAFYKGGSESVNELSYIRTHEFLSLLEQNKDIFLNENLLENEDFLTGLGITYEKFLRQRSQEKRALIKEIFLEFSKSKHKKSFDLERSYAVVEIISLGAVSFLAFLNKEIVSSQMEVIKQEASYSRTMSKLQKQYPISKFLDNYRNLNVSLSQNTLQKKVKFILKSEDEYVAELVSLGIFRYITPDKLFGHSFGGNDIDFRMHYTFTLFGLDFIKNTLSGKKVENIDEN